MLISLAQAVAPEESFPGAFFIEQIVDSNNFVPLLIFGVGGVIAVVSVVSVTLKGLLLGRARERTRQEIAAYVAEGSISASEGERLLEAGEAADGKRDKRRNE